MVANYNAYRYALEKTYEAENLDAAFALNVKALALLRLEWKVEKMRWLDLSTALRDVHRARFAESCAYYNRELHSRVAAITTLYQELSEGNDLAWTPKEGLHRKRRPGLASRGDDDRTA